LSKRLCKESMERVRPCVSVFAYKTHPLYLCVSNSLPQHLPSFQPKVQNQSPMDWSGGGVGKQRSTNRHGGLLKTPLTLFMLWSPKQRSRYTMEQRQLVIFEIMNHWKSCEDFSIRVYPLFTYHILSLPINHSTSYSANSKYE
jgi:hypothetical protein